MDFFTVIPEGRGSTSAPNIRWTDLDTPNGSWAEAQGAITYSEASK